MQEQCELQSLFDLYHGSYLLLDLIIMICKSYTLKLRKYLIIKDFSTRSGLAVDDCRPSLIEILDIYRIIDTFK